MAIDTYNGYERDWNARIDASEQKEHERAMEKMRQATQIAQAFAADETGRQFTMDLHIDRYGDVQLKIQARRS